VDALLVAFEFGAEARLVGDLAADAAIALEMPAGIKHGAAAHFEVAQLAALAAAGEGDRDGAVAGEGVPVGLGEIGRHLGQDDFFPGAAEGVGGAMLGAAGAPGWR
jgi:hypothetical protein